MAPQLTPDQIAQVSGLVTQYISTQREKYAPRAIPLSAQQQAALKGFFSPQASGWYAAARAARRACCQPRFLPDAEKLGLQQSARPIDDGGDYIFRRGGVARDFLRWSTVSRTRPRGAVSATRHLRVFPNFTCEDSSMAAATRRFLWKSMRTLSVVDLNPTRAGCFR